MSMLGFPNKVWEPTGIDWEGRHTWSSRPATPADHERRRQYIRDYIAREDAREQLPPDRVHRREG